MTRELAGWGLVRQRTINERQGVGDGRPAGARENQNARPDQQPGRAFTNSAAHHAASTGSTRDHPWNTPLRTFRVNQRSDSVTISFTRPSGPSARR